MKTNSALFLFLACLPLFFLFGCKKEVSIAEREKNIQKLWKLDAYLINGTDKTGSLTISAYNESYTSNEKYDRSYTDKNGNKLLQNGSWRFENANRLHISGAGSIEFTANGTASSSYYDIIRLTETELWYSFTNGNSKHELRLSRK